MKYIIVILGLFFSLSVNCQISWQWANEISSIANEEVLDIHTDPLTGTSYSCGYFDGDLSTAFPIGFNGTPDMSTPKGNRDAFVAKYDAAGNIQWAFKIGGVGATVEAEAICIGPSGNIYVTGEFFGAAVEFQGVTSSILSSQLPTGATKDMFLAAYNPNGELLWVTRSIDTGNSIGFGITADVNGIYVAGRFAGDITFPPLGPVTWTGIASYFDAYITKFDFSGNAIDVKTIFSTTGDGHVKAFDVATDGNDVYAIGTSGSTTWTYGPTGLNPSTNNNGLAGTDDIWVISFRENNFNLNWAQVIGSVENDVAKGIAQDNLGLYLAGGAGGASVNFPGIAPVASIGVAKDIFSSKLFKATGLTDWVFLEQNNSVIDAHANDISIDATGDLYITGSHNDITQFNGGLNPVSSLGGEDVFVMSRKNTGVFNWVQSAGSLGNDEGLGISHDNNGNVYIGGAYDLAATFGSINLNTNSNQNGFVAKLSICSLNIACPPNQTVTANASCQYTLPDYTGLATPFASCGIASVKQIPIAGTTVNAGVNPITLYLTDNGGNVDSCSFNVIVEANVNPTVVNCGDWLQNETTVGQGDTENNFGCVGFSTPGEDVYYQVTVPAGNYWIQFNMDSVVDANDAWVETFWIGGSCPLGGGCLDADFYDIGTQQFSGGGNTIQYLAVGPGTYYFVVDAQNDGIDSYNFGVNCLDSGIEFDTSATCGDPNNDGIIPYVNGSPALATTTCQSVNICHDMYIANYQDFEWVDSVYMNLGSCYTNVVPTTVAGFYQPGNWVGTYDLPSNSISWEFNNTSVATFGDGSGGNYSCDLGKTRLYTLCFTADISSTCLADSNLNISLLIVDDAVGSGGGTVAGMDYILSDDFTISNPAPTITCPANLNINNDVGVCTAIVNGIAPTAVNDNCPNPIVTYILTGATTGSGNNDASGTTFNLGTTTVTYIVTDSTGNIDSCNFTVTVIDNEAPALTCPANVTINTDPAMCFAIVTGINPTGTENCTIDSVNYVLTGATTGSGLNSANGLAFNVGVTTVNYFAADMAGNISNCSFTVTVVDNQFPTITCPANIAVPNDPGVCTAMVNGIAPVSVIENCTLDSVSYVLTGATIGSGLNDASGIAFNMGITTITYTAIDIAGNTVSCNFTVTVSENQAPTIICPSNVNVNNDLGICGAIVNGIAPVAFGDNCAIDSVSYVLTGATTGSGLNDVSGLTFNLGTTTVTYNIVDMAGNSNSCFFTVTVVDNEAPSLTCPLNTLVGNDVGVCTAIVNGIAPIIIDNCSVASIGYTLSGATTASGINDASGLTFNPGITTVTYTVVDGAGNISNCNFIVTVNDTETPTLSCPANVVATNSPGTCSAVVSGLTLLSANDNCAIDSVSYVLSGATTGSGLNSANGNIFNVGITTVTYSVTDTSGNVGTCNFTVTINDTEPPTISCPANVTANNDVGTCTAVVNGLAPVLVNDNCTIDSVSYVLTGATTGSGLNDASGLSYNIGVTTITYTVTDVTGNVTTCNFTITVNDSENPTITCLGNIIVNNDPGNCSALVNGIAPLTFNDNCAIDSVSYVLTGATIGNGLNDASGNAFNRGITTVTYTITDAAGNIDTCNFTVTVNDTEPPTITCPANVSINNNGGVCSAVVNGIAPIAFGDNCAIDSVSYVLSGATVGSGLNDASGLTFNIGITTITYTVTDLAGNINTCNFTVTVNDTEPPTITCPTNVSTPNDIGVCSALVNGIAPITFGDNCAIDSVSYVLSGATVGSGLNDASGNTFNPGITTITYTVTDMSGNSTSCNFIVTVLDNEAPLISCPANISVGNDIGACVATVNGIAPLSFSDNCSVDSVSYVITGATIGSGLNDASGTLFNLGVSNVTYTVTDGVGNFTTCNFEITVSDTEIPTISCPPNVSLPVSASGCDAVVNTIAPLAFNDNCTIDSISYVLTGATTGSGLNDVSGLTFNAGITTITYFITDLAGNIDSCDFTVMVIDSINPSITCPSNTTVNNDMGSCNATVNGIAPMNFSDNCTIDTVFYNLLGTTTGSGANDASGTIFNSGTTTVEYIVLDLAGNGDTCSFTVTVTDNEAPSITCPTDIVVCDTNIVVPLPIVGDNCMIASYSNDYNLTNDASGIYPYGITTVNWTVIDTAGNMNSCTMSVESEIPPVSNAGEDQTLVGINNTYFNATNPSIGSGSWTTVSGSGDVQNYVDPLSHVGNLAQGENVFEWTVTNGTCPSATDEVIITVLGLTIPNGFSPNGDGDNDLFVVHGLDQLENEVIIFNRWGVELFQAENYQNDWDGRSNVGKELPEDTYFYIIKIHELEKEFSGFVVLKR